MPITKNFEIAGGIHIGGVSPPVLFAGPCVIEGEEMIMRHAQSISEISRKVGIQFIFKASYDKANRTSLKSFRGPGLDEGLRILEKVRREVGVPVITDAHSALEIKAAANVVDVIQIPAFLCRQTDMLTVAAKTGKTVNVKKGQFLAPEDIRHIILKITESGGEKLFITERGTTFGYHRLIIDFTGLVKMRELGYPIVFDATHSVQSPGGLDGVSGGESRYAPYLAWAGAAVGVDGLFIETHEDPSVALSDGANMLKLSDLPEILERFLEIAHIAKRSDA